MSIDNHAETGALVSLESFSNLFKPVHLDGLRRDAARMFSMYCQKVDDDEHVYHCRQVMSLLRSCSTIEEAISIIAKAAPPHDEDHSRNNNYRHLSIEMQMLRSLASIVLPCVPTNLVCKDGELYLAFDFDECFEVKTTPIGQSLAATLGKESIRPEVWVYMA